MLLAVAALLAAGRRSNDGTRQQHTYEVSNSVFGIPFSWKEVERSLVRRAIGGLQVPVVGRELLRRMKLATGLEKDQTDAELLGDYDD